MSLTVCLPRYVQLSVVRDFRRRAEAFFSRPEFQEIEKHPEMSVDGILAHLAGGSFFVTIRASLSFPHLCSGFNLLPDGRLQPFERLADRQERGGKRPQTQNRAREIGGRDGRKRL
jgi:hypothetical protein